MSNLLSLRNTNLTRYEVACLKAHVTLGLQAHRKYLREPGGNWELAPFSPSEYKALARVEGVLEGLLMD